MARRGNRPPKEKQGFGIRQLLWQDIVNSDPSKVDNTTEMVRFDRHMLMEKVAPAPSQVTLHARDPAIDEELSAPDMVFRQ